MRRPSIKREIWAALIFKAAALLALYFAFFAQSDRQRPTPEAVGAALFETVSDEARGGGGPGR